MELITFNNYKDKMNLDDMETIVRLISKYCRNTYKARLLNNLYYNRDMIYKWEILDRLTKKDDYWCFTTDDVTEFRLVRKCILGEVHYDWRDHYYKNEEDYYGRFK